MEALERERGLSLVKLTPSHLVAVAGLTAPLVSAALTAMSNLSLLTSIPMKPKAPPAAAS